MSPIFFVLYLYNIKNRDTKIVYSFGKLEREFYYLLFKMFFIILLSKIIKTTNTVDFSVFCHILVKLKKKKSIIAHYSKSWWNDEKKADNDVEIQYNNTYSLLKKFMISFKILSND